MTTHQNELEFVNAMQTNAGQMQILVEAIANAASARDVDIDFYLNEARIFVRYLQHGARRAVAAIDPSEEDYSYAEYERYGCNCVIEDLADTFADMIRAFRC